MDKSCTNLEKDIQNIVADKSMEENIVVDNVENLEKDCENIVVDNAENLEKDCENIVVDNAANLEECEDLQNENSIGDDKDKYENLEEKNTDKNKGETGPKKKYIRNFYNLGGGKFISLKEDDVHRVYKLPRRSKRIELSACTKEYIVELKEELEVGFNGNSKKKMEENNKK
ncbi:hypothetical protein LIER_02709 [Lithospermum erythrorhizon]|uniref:Uncharacterized protein n=1 Tax=Lithospermum erythrorhizon TaxID=34254 RepID=A0AAV3NQF6_LITER